ncbi:MAG TPA: aminopeptidase [Gaiellaceae bacterium]|jgi:aminopeptidase|nr:aminopeptidase [Gaiellaceae bacterium]
MNDRLNRLAELSVHGANVQEGQIVMVNAEIGLEEQARATAAAAYKRGAKFVDVVYFDPHLKRARVENADPDTLDFVPAWYGERVLEHAEENGARVTLHGVTAPNVMDGLDKSLTGKDMLPRVKELTKVVGERLTNWCIVPAPHPAWATLVHPDLPANEAYEKLWNELEHVLRLDEPDPLAAWDERMAVLNDYAERLAARRFDAIELRGPGTELTIGLLPTATWWAADFSTAKGLRHLPNLPTEEVFTTPDPLRTSGHVTATKPLVLQDGTIIRGLRVRFENGVAVEIDADENAEALRGLTEIDEGARRLGELALVDGQGRIGPLGTVFYSTLLDENASSHIALGGGFPFLVEDADTARVNDSAQHIDFMIGSAELAVDGVTADGERVPVLRNLAWQI